MWIFAITSIHYFISNNKLLLTKTLVKTLIHIICYHTIIRSSMLIRFYHKSTTKIFCIFLIFYRINYNSIIFYICYNKHCIKVFCSRANHSRPTNIDVFYDFIKIISFFNSLFKRIKIHTHQVNSLNTKLFCLI